MKTAALEGESIFGNPFQGSCVVSSLGDFRVLLPIPYTLHSTIFTPHPTSHTLLPTPYSLHPTCYTLHPTPYTLQCVRPGRQTRVAGVRGDPAGPLKHSRLLHGKVAGTTVPATLPSTVPPTVPPTVVPCAPHSSTHRSTRHLAVEEAPLLGVEPLSAARNVMYRGTSLIRNSAPLGPYSSNMPRALWWP